LNAISLPSEWTPWQLYQAAALTIEVQRRLNSVGYQLKDASAWNVIFVRGKPLFCDHGSVAMAKGDVWWSFGQYVRNFIFPLLLYKRRGIVPREIFSIYRDGPSADDLKKYGLRAFNVPLRCVPLILSRSIKVKSGAIEVKQRHSEQRPPSSGRKYIYDYLEYVLKVLNPVNQNRNTEWSDYEHSRSHYSSEDLKRKRSFLINAGSVFATYNRVSLIDLGCNGGEYLGEMSKVIQNIERMVGVDVDHLSLDTAASRLGCIDTFNVDFDNLVLPTGALGLEYDQLWERIGTFDLCLFLAIVHHLTITHAIPLGVVIRKLRDVVKPGGKLIFEAVYPSDPMAVTLSKQRSRNIDFINAAWYEEHFDGNFTIINREILPSGTRELFFLSCEA
jgi:SAM-dependent methyltransferase